MGIVNSCTEENTIGFFWFTPKFMPPPPSPRTVVNEVIGYVIIEWPPVQAQTIEKDALVEAINVTLTESDTLYYHSDDRYNGKETSVDGFWADMQSALRDAKNLFIDENPENDIKFGISQEQVDTAAAALTGAAIRLIPKEQLNATALYEAIQVENARNLNASDYTHNTWSIYKNAKDEAEAYLDSLFETVDGAVVPTDVNKAGNQETADLHAVSMQHAYDYELVKQSGHDAFVNGLTPSDARWLIEKSAELESENFTADSWNAWDSAYKAMRLAMENGYETKLTMGEYVYTCRLAKEKYYSLVDNRDTISVNVRVQDNYGAKNPQWALDAPSGTYEKKITLGADKSVDALISTIGTDGCDITKKGADAAQTKNQPFVLLLINGKLTPEYLYSGSVYSDNTKAVQLRHDDEVLLLRTVLPTQTYYIHDTTNALSYTWYQSEVGITTLESPKLSESGYIEIEAGKELAVSASKVSASMNITDKNPKPFSGATVFISEAKESKEAAKSSPALTNTGAVTDANGKASFRVLESGWYRLSAVGIGEQTTTDVSGDGYVQGVLPNAAAGTYILVHASEPADNSPVKAEFKAELDGVYSLHGEDFYGGERFAEVESAYTSACAVLANSASTIKQAFDAKENAIATMREKISETERENVLVAAQIEDFFLYLPDSAAGLNTSNKRHFEGLKTLYEKMTAYQRSQLTAAQEKLYRELLAAYSEDGSTLPAGEKHNVRIEIEVEYDSGIYPHGIFYRVNGAESGFYERFLNETGVYETEIESGDILDIYFTVNVERDFPPRLSDVEIVSGDARYKDSSRSSSVGVSYVSRRIDEFGTEDHRYQDMLKVVGGNSDTVIRISFGEKAAPADELGEAKAAALAELKTAYDGYNKPDYSAKNWARLADAYNEGVSEINAADSAEAANSAKVAAKAAMLAVPMGFGQSSDERVGSLGSVHVVVENTTYMDAPFTGTIANAYIPLNEDSTMMTAVLDALERNGFEWRNSTGASDKKIEYLAAVSKGGVELAEFDGGPKSGWMGTLNDWFTNEGFQSFKASAARRDYRIVDGDEIRVMYTVSGYGSDLGGSWHNSDTSLKSLSVNGGSLHPAFDGVVKEYLLVKDGTAISVLPTAANKNYQVKTFVNGVNTQRDVDYYRRGENIPAAAGDDINIGVGERNWLSMNNQGAEARYYTGTWYTIHIVDAESSAAAEKLINAIGSVSYSNYKTKRASIEMALTAFDVLSAAAKERVSNSAVLDAASDNLNFYMGIDNVKALLSGLIQNSKAADWQVVLAKADIERADAAYKALTAEQKGYITVGDVSNYNALVERLSALAATYAEQIEGAEFTPGGDVLAPKSELSDEGATASVTEDEISSAVDAAKSGDSSSLTIAPEGAEGAKSIAVNIPTSAAKNMAEEEDLGLNVETAVGSVAIPTGALKSVSEQAEGDKIEIVVEEKVAEDVKGKAGAEDIDTEDALIVGVTIKSGGKAISDFGGHAIEILIPVTGDKHKEGETYKVIIVSGSGNIESTVGRCEKRGGKLVVVVRTTHLSTFIVTSQKGVLFRDALNHWAMSAIQYAFDKNIMTGVGAGEFDPEGTFSRAMLATMLYRLEGRPSVSGMNNPFSDVAAGQWYTDAIIWAAKNNIVNGYGGGLFGPSDDISREQMATMLLRYSKYKKYDTSKKGSLAAFADAKNISAWALDGMKWANAEGLVTGHTASLLAPAGTATRAEAATLLMRFMENIVK